MKVRIESLDPDKENYEMLVQARSLTFPDVEYLQEWFSNYSQTHLRRLSFDLQYLIEEFPDSNGIKVLELGSIPPILTCGIHQKGFDVTGYDIDPSRFDRCIEKNNLRIVQGTIGNTIPFENEEFDAILMNEVFEHLNSNLITVFSELKRVLKKEGKLFISTPNLKSMVGIKNFLLHGKTYSCSGEIYEEYEKIEKFGHMGHVREYTPNELITFLNKLDFKVLTLIYRGKYPKKYRVVDIFFPRLKPFFSVIASKK